MTEVTRNEAMAIREVYPNTHIARTKHHWYTVETFEVQKLLRKLRGEDNVEVVRKPRIKYSAKGKNYGKHTKTTR